MPSVDGRKGMTAVFDGLPMELAIYKYRGVFIYERRRKNASRTNL